MRRPKFDKYYTGPWEYDQGLGVGIQLKGIPTDPLKLIEVLQDFSCNPAASRRILEVLVAGEAKLTTVQWGLDFNKIGDAFAAVGVTLTIVPPVEDVSNQVLDTFVWMMYTGRQTTLSFDELNATQMEIVNARLAHLKQSVTQLPHGFGRYERERAV